MNNIEFNYYYSSNKHFKDYYFLLIIKMNNIYGTIGIMFLIKGPRKIIIMSDQHDTLPECSNKINIASWFKKKFNSSKILLEEVPREDNKLIELWQESPHTQELKKLYLDNPRIISGMDIRPFMIPFSWEVLEQMDTLNQEYNIDMIEYLDEIDKFFSLQNKFIMKNLPNYNVNILKDTLLGKHYLMIKDKYEKFLEELNNEQLLTRQVRYLNDKHNSKLSILNNLLDDIMEWYICAQIELYNDKSIIIHAGLAHTDKIIKLLQSHYKFEIKYREGINNMSSVHFGSRSGCTQLPLEIDKQFGGKKVFTRYIK